MLKKDYCQSKQLKPEHCLRAEEKAEKRKSFIKKMILFFGILILIIDTIYLLFFSSVFKIKKITITGLSKVGELATAERIVQDSFQFQRFGFFSNQNAFFVNKKYLENTLKRQIEIENLDLQVIYPNALKINIVKSESVAIFLADKKYYSILKDGTLRAEIKDIKNYELPIVSYSTSTEIIIGHKYLTEKQTDYLKKLLALFSFYFKDKKVTSFELAGLESREIKLITGDNWYLLFDLDLDIEESLKLASSVWKEKFKNTKIQYLDVRIKDRVYYK